MTMATQRMHRGTDADAPIPFRSDLQSGVARLRMRDYGTLEPRRKQRLGVLLKRLREDRGESMDTVAGIATGNGAPGVTKKTIWYLEALTDPKVAAARSNVSYFAVAYLLEYYGMTPQGAWDFITAEDGLAATSSATPDKRAEARAISDLYVDLTERSPEWAARLLSFARFALSELEHTP